MSGRSAISEWPPTLSPNQLRDLTLQATTYAFATGLLYLPVAEKQPPAPTSAIHAPIALFPSPFPRVAQDEEFLDTVMGTENGVGKVDDFIGQLWTGWKVLRDEGLVQPLHLGLFRSDYLLDAPPDGPLSLKQVEFNTISSSFGLLSQRVSALHRHLLASTAYYGLSSDLKAENFPTNETVSGLAEGLAAAHKAYGRVGSQILFVVQPGERNVFDQRPLEYELLHSSTSRIDIQTHVLRQTFDELFQSATIDPGTRALRIKCPSDINPAGSVEISTVYFRAGYAPTEYSTPDHYATRFLLEKSKAIKCPTIALQLAGGKKVQEVLTQPEFLERFLSDEKRWGKEVFSEQDIQELRQSFMGMWGLDASEDPAVPDRNSVGSAIESYGVRKARENALALVLKPQREGGGNNVYKASIPAFLDALPPQERQAWIAMELIRPPEGAGNYLVRAGGGDLSAVKVDVVSELGIFGWSLFGDSVGNIKDAEAGWLLRTKGKDSDEGGVATGFSVLDSVLLVDA